jgi:PKHD-type hydroxylase
MDSAKARPYFCILPKEVRAMSAAAQPSTMTYVTAEDTFTPAELDRIEACGEALMPRGAVIADGEQQRRLERIRITQVAWITHSEQTLWLYERIRMLVRQMNDRFYQFDLRGFSDPFQYTIYRDSDGGHYDWHVDQGPTVVQRKLSITVQLSDPASYEGCDLLFRAGNKVETAPRTRGALIAFPSYVLHRVTPIVSGTRKSLVIWASGPKFR